MKMYREMLLASELYKVKIKFKKSSNELTISCRSKLPTLFIVSKRRKRRFELELKVNSFQLLLHSLLYTALACLYVTIRKPPHLDSTRYPTLELVSGQGTDCSNLPDTFEAAELTEYDRWATGEKIGEFKKTFTSLNLAELVDKCLVIVRAKASSGRFIKERLAFRKISSNDYDTIATSNTPGNKHQQK